MAVSRPAPEGSLQQRPYRDRHDLARMRQLLVDGVRTGISASYMHPGYFDWATHFPPDETENGRNLRLWEDVEAASSALVAWAIYLRKEGSFDLFVHPSVHGSTAHEAMMEEFVAWAEARARAAGLAQLWPFWAMQQDEVLTRLMIDHGYTVDLDDRTIPLFERSLDDLPAVSLPSGYAVQAVSTVEDARLRADITFHAFASNDDWPSYWQSYSLFMSSPVYEGDRDLFVRTPDGRGASACTIWFDTVNAAGLFEPVGTHPDFQRRGLGRAVMAEGMRRMKAAGMQRALVGFAPDNHAARALYTSMGFAASSYFTSAEKEL